MKTVCFIGILLIGILIALYFYSDKQPEIEHFSNNSNINSLLNGSSLISLALRNNSNISSQTTSTPSITSAPTTNAASTNSLPDMSKYILKSSVPNISEYLHKSKLPDMHIHAFSPLEVYQGAETLGLTVEDFLAQLRESGLGTLPGTAAEILDDSVREVLCPDKLDTNTWLHVIEAAHRCGFRTTATIMFGHIDLN